MTTDQVGHFQFQIKAPKQATVALVAQKEGYADYEIDVMLGETSLDCRMRKSRL